jgi:ferritin
MELLQKYIIAKSDNSLSDKTNEPIISQRIIDLLNFRIQREELSARKYLAMYMWLEDKAYMNSAKIWKKNYEEEREHANWAREYLLSLDIRPHTPSLEQVPEEFESLGDIIRVSLEHEIQITKECQELAKACMEEGDFLTYTLAHKYVSEQVEELERSFNMANLLEIYGEDKLSLALLDTKFLEFI